MSIDNFVEKMLYSKVRVLGESGIYTIVSLQIYISTNGIKGIRYYLSGKGRYYNRNELEIVEANSETSR